MRPRRVGRLIAGIAALAALVFPATGRPADDSIEALRALRDRGSYARMESGARALVARVESEKGRRSPEYAAALDLLVESLWRLGRPRDPEARRLADLALSIKEETLGGKHPDLAPSLNNLGSLLRLAGEQGASIAAHRRALAIQEKFLGADSLEAAGTMVSLASAVMDGGDMSEARELADKSLVIREAKLSPDHPDVATSLSVLASVLRNIGLFAEARRLHERALAIRETSLPPDHPDLALSINNVADLLREAGEYATARQLYERALRIRENTVPPDPLRLPEVLASLATLYQDLGDYDAALPLHERALAMLQGALGADHLFTAFQHRAIAMTAWQKGDLNAALKHFGLALGIWEKTLGPRHPLVAMTQENLADLHREAGRFAEARPLYESSLRFWEQSPFPGHPVAGDALHGLAELLKATGDLAGAERRYRKALEIRSRALGPDHPRSAEVLIDLARIEAVTGRPVEALEDSLAGQSVLRSHLGRTARSLSEREVLRYQTLLGSGLDVALSLVTSRDAARLPPRSTGRVWDEVARSRALVLDEITARHRSILENQGPTVSALVRRLTEAGNKLARLTLVGPQPESPVLYRTTIERARADVELAEQELAAASIGFRKEREYRDKGLDEIASAIPADTALVAYVIQSSWYALIMPSSRSAPVAIPLGPPERIEPLIRAWRREAGSPPRDAAAGERCRRAGDALRRALWDPVARHLEGARQVLLVPDGTIHLVSFDALPSDQGRFLIETGPLLHYLSAERDLAALAEPHSPGRGLLAIGGPDFDAGGSSGGPAPAAHRFEPLPSARYEADEVESLWSRGGANGRAGGGVVKLTGMQADESAFKRQATGRRVIHLATHALLGSDGSGNAGLALAGANRADRRDAAIEQDDGILTVAEIASLDLRGVEWVVLSACETGLGTLKAGEGVLGLRRSFQVAGARTLIMSLWPVGDHETRAWINALYEARLSGSSTSEAIRQAGSSRIGAARGGGATAHPYSWGAFVAAGDWR